MKISICMVILAMTTLPLISNAADSPPAANINNIQEFPALLAPEEAAKRLAQFEAKNAPEMIAALGEEFFQQVNTKIPPPVLLRKEHQAYTNALKIKDYRAALKAFKTYFIKRLTLDPVWASVPSHGGPLYMLNSGSAADLLLEGKVIRQKKLLNFGRPGQANWGIQIPPEKDEWSWGDGRQEQFYTVDFLNPLLERYLHTRDSRFLRQWEAYIEDWALNNYEGLNVYGPYNLQPGAAGTIDHLLQLAKTLRDLGLGAPEAMDSISDTAFARLMLRYVREMPMYALVFMRDNAQNWSIERAVSFIQAGIIYADFKDSLLWVREGRRRLETYDSLVNLRDGSEIQPDIWYLHDWLYWNDPAYLTLQNELLRPGHERTHSDWFTPDWDSWFRESRRLRGRFLIHSVAVNNEDPVGLGCDKRDRGSGLLGKVHRYEPGLYDEPDARQRLDLIARKNNSPVPDYTSEWFPYGGFYYLRTGWKPEDSYASFFNSPGLGSNGFRGQANNNAFYLSAWGMDFLWSGAVAAYNYCKSPIRVDGRDQNKFAGRPQSNHRTFGTAWLTPPTYRWHSSPAIDFCEGVYDGPYSNTSGHHPRAYSIEGIVEANRSSIRSANHHRMVHALKEHGLWIITDRMNDVNEREYRQDWRLPSLLQDIPTKIPAYAKKEVILDLESHQIRTESKTHHNLTLHHFSDQSLAYHEEIEDASNSPDQPKKRLVNFHRVSAQWRAKGASQLVTLLFPRKCNGVELLQPEPLKLCDGRVAGFRVHIQGGVKIAYLAAPETKAALEVLGVHLLGEALLVVQEDNKLHGLALGASMMQVKGVKVEAPSQDFAFEINNESHPEQTIFTPIYRPIDPVRIAPEREVFFPEEHVTLSSNTLGVEIRYTLDGSDPDLHSAIYKAPILLMATTKIKARAFRSGIRQIPHTMDGTLASAVSTATFRLEAPIEPVVLKGDCKPGLHYKYFEDDWKNIYLTTEYQVPLRSGVVPSVLDTSVKREQQTKAYAFSYSGYIKIPQDGVYTFYAPSELSQGSIWPGYDLQLWVGHRWTNGKATGLNAWYPGTFVHALGTWSIALKKGLHPFRAHFSDIRPGQVTSVLSYTHYKTLNFAGMDKYVWEGERPQIYISGPGISKQDLAHSWFYYE